MWECMVLAFKALVGAFLWVCVLGAIGAAIAGISIAWTRYHNPPAPTKPKYEGQKIVIDGGKKKDG